MPYKQLSTDQERAVWFVDNSSKVNRQYPVCKAPTLINKVKTNQLGRLFYDESPYVSGFYQLMGNSQWPGHVVKQEGNGNPAYYMDAQMGHGPMEITMGI